MATVPVTPDRAEREALKKREAREQLYRPGFDDFRTDLPVVVQEQDYSDTSRELNKKSVRADMTQRENAQNPLGSIHDYYAEENNYSPGAQYAAQQAALSKHQAALRKQGDVRNSAIWADIIAQAEDSGVSVTSDDVNNMIEWQTVNTAADRVSKLWMEDPELRTNRVAVDNIMESLQDRDPLMAGLVSELVMDKIKASATDPSFLENAVGFGIEALSAAMEPFIWLNEQGMQSIRGGLLGAQNAENTGDSIGAFMGGLVANRSEVEEGDFNEEYLATLYTAENEDGSRIWSDKEIDVAIRISRYLAENPGGSLWDLWESDFATDDEAKLVIGAIEAKQGPRVAELDSLMKQIDSAHLGNTGQMVFGAGVEDDVQFDPSRSSALRTDAANVTGFGASVLFDPTIAGSKLYRGVQAARYALLALAPAPEGAAGARSILKAGPGIGRLRLNNKTFRFFNTLSGDLNDYEAAQVKAASAEPGSQAATEAQAAADGIRRRISRRYGLDQDNIVEDILETAPRTDGKITVDDIAGYIDDTNNKYLTEWVAAENFATESGVLAQDLPRVVAKILDEKDLQSFDKKLAKTRQNKRADVTPQMTSLGAVRSRVSNAVAANLMPAGKAIGILQRYVDTSSAKATAESFAENAEQIGDEARSFKRGARPESVIDSTGRLFSSIAIDDVIDLADPASASMVYKYARSYFPRKIAEAIENSWRNGDIGSRRILMSGVVRAAAQSRGLVVSKEAANEWWDSAAQKRLVTGSREFEAYGAEVTERTRPSRKLAEAQERAVQERAVQEESSRLLDEDPVALIPEEPVVEAPPVVKVQPVEEFVDANPELGLDEALVGFRNQVLDDDAMLDQFLIERYAINETVDSAPITRDWILEPVPGAGQGTPPAKPSEVGAAAGGDARFYNDGTISLKALSDIEEAYGSEEMLAWLHTGYIDNGVGQLYAGTIPIPTAVSRLKDGNGLPIRGSLGVPQDWWAGVETVMASRRGGMRIKVPWAQGGVKGREAKRLDGIQDQVEDGRTYLEDSLRRGYLDDELDEWIISQRELIGADPRFAPGPARTPDIPLIREPRPAPLDIETAGRRVSLSESGGVESALHMDQTTTHMRVPTLRDMEDMRGEMGWVGKGMYYGSKGLETYTNYWSIATLFGWRFSIRNAVEEWGLWFLTAGGVSELVKGRMVSTARRRATKEMYVKEIKTGADKGKMTVAWVPTQGLVGRSIERGRQYASKKAGREYETYGQWADEWSEARGFPGFFMRNILIPTVGQRVSPVVLDRALAKYATGDTEEWSRIVMEGLIGHRVGGRTMGSWGLLSDEDLDIVRLAMESSHAMALVDDVAQSALYLNSARNPAGQKLGRMGLPDDDLPPGVSVGTMNEGDAAEALQRAVAGLNGSFQGRINSLDMVAVTTKPQAEQFHHLLRSVFQGDGVMGEAAVRGLYEISRGRTTIRQVQNTVADIIRNDPSGVYVQRLSRLQTEEGIEQFAADYVEDVLNLFQRQDGQMSTRLLDKFFDNDGAYLGWGKELQGDLIDDELAVVDRVTVRDLRSIPVEERPSVLMPSFGDKQYIPYANTLPSLLSGSGWADRAFMWMGRQNARLSREPIFWGNVLTMWKASSGRRDQLARAIHDARGGVPWEEADDAARLRSFGAAGELVSKDVFDRSYALSLSFMDNPENRSNLAWKARNISRYYRASEDFYRRMRRVGESNPEGFVKAAIAYNYLEDSGFAFKDDRGDMYFMYPTNYVTDPIMRTVTKAITGVEVDTSPLQIGGKVLGLTPSADPLNMIPPVTSGWGQIPGAIIFAAKPEWAGARALVLGQFNQPTGSIWGDLKEAIIPAGVSRLSEMMDEEAATTSQVDAKAKTLAAMMSWGYLDYITLSDGTKIPHNTATGKQVETSKEMQAAEVIATGHWITKMVASWFLPAYPRTVENNVSDWARSNGSDSLKDAWYDFNDTVTWDPEYLKMVEEATGEKIYDPWNYAMMEWWKLKTNDVLDSDGEWDGGSFLPFTVSGYEDAGSPTQQLAKMRAVSETHDWYFGLNEYEDQGWRNYPPEHQDAAMFLAPREGEWDYNGQYIAKFFMGTRTRKKEGQFVMDVADSEVRAKVGRVNYVYDSMLNDLDPRDPSYRDQRRLIEQARKSDKEDLKASGLRYNTQDNLTLKDRDDALAQMILLVDYEKSQKPDGQLEPDTAVGAISLALDTYNQSERDLARVAGNSAQAVYIRDQIKFVRNNDYEAIGNYSPQAKHFIEAILLRD